MQVPVPCQLNYEGLTPNSITEEGMKENPDIQKMTSFLQGVFLDEAQGINRAFDLMLGYQKYLNEDQ